MDSPMNPSIPSSVSSSSSSSPTPSAPAQLPSKVAMKRALTSQNSKSSLLGSISSSSSSSSSSINNAVVTSPSNAGISSSTFNTFTNNISANSPSPLPNSNGSTPLPSFPGPSSHNINSNHINYSYSYSISNNNGNNSNNNHSNFFSNSTSSNGNNFDFLRTYESTTPETIRWQKGDSLGRGAYGTVSLGLNLDSGELIAVKQIIVDSDADTRALETVKGLQKEINVMHNLKHNNIVRYIGTEWSGKTFNIFLEYVPGGSICSLVNEFGTFSESVVKVYTRQILLGLEYLHDVGVIHRDIKGANILVDHFGNVKLADFGCSKHMSDIFTPRESNGSKSLRGTPFWMAP